MNLQKLFETQKALDEAIVKKKGLEGQDLLPQKILALQVELGELANEWRGFKFWSDDQEARDFVPNPNDICEECKCDPIIHKDNKITGWCDHCDGCGVHYHNPLLEEYVDCLHFILSIGNDLKTKYQYENNCPETFKVLHSLTEQQLLTVFARVSTIDGMNYVGHIRGSQVEIAYHALFSDFMGLGYSLGFSSDQIEQAYYDKNKINHQRQANGY